MKKKDIVIIIVCILVIVVSVYIMIKSFTPKPKDKPTQNKETIEFTGEIDQDAITKLKSRKDYGVPPMDNIGRENPFASL
ncbi:MAG: hypothetical protein AAB632_02040 [Patescibacteria group bacterium]